MSDRPSLNTFETNVNICAKKCLVLTRLLTGVGAAKISASDLFTLISKDTEFCIKVLWYQTSTYGSTDFRDHWYWESDPFDTCAA